jgi:H-type lectin domain
MAEINPPGWLQNRTDHTAQTDRTLADTLTAGSAVVGINDFKVTQRAAGANMSVDVAGGLAFVEGTESATQGAYTVRSDSTPTNVAISASNPTLPRIDLIVARVQDAFYSGSTNSWSIQAVTGTAASGPTAPAAPNNSLILAQISVGANVTTITNANITDKRTISWGRLYSGDLVCTSTTRPANPWQGLTIFETDTLSQYIYSGGWLNTGKAGGAPYAVAAGSSTVTSVVSGSVCYANATVTFPTGRFSQIPNVFAGIATGGGRISNADMAMQAYSISTTGCSIEGMWINTNTATVNIAWLAVQMTPTSTNG